jgi:hypothetical protein
MLKLTLFLLPILLSWQAFAEAPCDIRIGRSLGIKVVEFGPGHVTFSKIPFKESSAKALQEEMISLQDMGLCKEKIFARNCTLKYEKLSSVNVITMYRGSEKWNSWKLKSKGEAQNYLKGLKLIGFCS